MLMRLVCLQATAVTQEKTQQYEEVITERKASEKAEVILFQIVQ